MGGLLVQIQGFEVDMFQLEAASSSSNLVLAAMVKGLNRGTHPSSEGSQTSPPRPGTTYSPPGNGGENNEEKEGKDTTLVENS